MRERANKQEREAAIKRFYQYHGDHSHDVLVGIDIEKMQQVAEHYRGRVDFSQYPAIASLMKTSVEGQVDA